MSDAPPLDLNDIVKGLLSDVRSGKANAKAAKKKPAVLRPKHESVNNPWIDEAVTLLINEYHCKCGAVHTFPNAYTFIERTRIRFGHPEQHMEKTSLTNIEHIYSHLPRRTELAITAVAHCQSCFTPDANRFAANQMPLPLGIH